MPQSNARHSGGFQARAAQPSSGGTKMERHGVDAPSGLPEGANTADDLNSRYQPLGTLHNKLLVVSATSGFVVISIAVLRND